jgi:hypothetical protein
MEPTTANRSGGRRAEELANHQERWEASAEQIDGPGVAELIAIESSRSVTGLNE